MENLNEVANLVDDKYKAITTMPNTLHSVNAIVCYSSNRHI